MPVSRVMVNASGLRTYGGGQTHGQQQQDTPQDVPVQAALQAALLVARPAVVLHGLGLVAWSVQHPANDKKHKDTEIRFCCFAVFVCMCNSLLYLNSLFKLWLK